MSAQTIQNKPFCLLQQAKEPCLDSSNYLYRFSLFSYSKTIAGPEQLKHALASLVLPQKHSDLVHRYI